MGNLISAEKKAANFDRVRRCKEGQKSKHNVYEAMTLHGKNRYLFGYGIQQNMPSIWVLDHLLSSYRPTLIVELGTGMGTLCTYFSVYGMFSDFEVEVISLDLIKPVMHEEICNINSPMTTILDWDIYEKDTIDCLTKKINEAERPFLLSDGKDPKSDEVNAYSKNLKSEVPIFAHDAILDGKPKFSWGYTEDKIDWNYVKRYEPYYSWSKEGDTRMMCMITL